MYAQPLSLKAKRIILDLVPEGVPYRHIVTVIHYLGEDATQAQVEHFARRRMNVRRRSRGPGTSNFAQFVDSP